MRDNYSSVELVTKCPVIFWIQSCVGGICCLGCLVSFSNDSIRKLFDWWLDELAICIFLISAFSLCLKSWHFEPKSWYTAFITAYQRFLLLWFEAGIILITPSKKIQILILFDSLLKFAMYSFNHLNGPQKNWA